MSLGLSLGFAKANGTSSYQSVSVLGQVDEGTQFNDLFSTATDHSVFIDFTIPNSEPLPATTQTLFYYGLNSSLSNYWWVRRDVSGSIQFVTRAQNAAQINITYNVDDIYPDKLMRIGFTDQSDGTQGLYMNGRLIATTTGKSIQTFLAGFTRLFVGVAPSITSDIDGDFVSKVTYYDTGFNRQQMESRTSVAQSTLGIQTSKVSNSVGFVGTGQSNMSGFPDVVEAPTLPEVAAGRLKKINPLGFATDYVESWSDEDGDIPLIPYFATTGSASRISYMGRVGNDIAADTGLTSVMVNCALSGAGMIPFWAAQRTDQNVGAGTTTSTGFLTWAAFESIKQLKSICNNYFIIDDQGQFDAKAGTAKATYKSYLEARLDYFDYYFPDLGAHVIVNIPQWDAAGGAVESEWIAIQEAREEVAQSRSNCIYVDTTSYSVGNADGIHYTAADQEVIGAQIATAIIDSL